MLAKSTYTGGLYTGGYTLVGYLHWWAVDLEMYDPALGTCHMMHHPPFSVWKSSRYLRSRSRLLVRMSTMGCGLLGFATNTCKQDRQRSVAEGSPQCGEGSSQAGAYMGEE